MSLTPACRGAGRGGRGEPSPVIPALGRDDLRGGVSAAPRVLWGIFGAPGCAVVCQGTGSASNPAARSSATMRWDAGRSRAPAIHTR